MSDKGLVEFVFSVQHIVYGTLYDNTNINSDTVYSMHSSTHFTVTKEERYSGDNGLRCLEFYIVQ